MAYFDRTDENPENCICDSCAKQPMSHEEVGTNGSPIPWKIVPCRVEPEPGEDVMQCYPWCWVPYYGAKCIMCGTDC